MQIYRFITAIVFCTTVSLGLVSFVACMVAGVSRQKMKDLKMNGKLCYLPGSKKAFRFGIVSVLCLSAAQIVGNLLILQIAFSRGFMRTKCSCIIADKKMGSATCFLLLSWVSFGVAILMMSGATSMSRGQPYGRGWLDGECYLVKDWVYVLSAGLILLTIVATIGSAILMLQTRPNQQATRNQRNIQLQQQSSLGLIDD